MTIHFLHKDHDRIIIEVTFPKESKCHLTETKFPIAFAESGRIASARCLASVSGLAFDAALDSAGLLDHSVSSVCKKMGQTLLKNLRAVKPEKDRVILHETSSRKQQAGFAAGLEKTK